MKSSSLPKETLIALSEKYGTPLYVYDVGEILRQYVRIKDAFSVFKHRIFYAGKALTNINILRALYEQGCDIDCVSINEIEIALSIGISPRRILFTPSCPHPDDIKKAMERAVHIHIDTLSVLEWVGKYSGSGYPVGLRINPHLSAAGGTLNISTAHIDSKFGISISYIEKISEIVEKYRIPIVGLHQHTGSDVKDAKHLIEGFNELSQLSSLFPEVKYIDVGGGFKVPYHDEDIAIDLEKCAADIKKIRDAYGEKTKKEYELWFEPGKFLVSESGYLLVKVNALKRTPTKTFAGVNSGFNHLIRPMFYDSYHHIENISNPEGKLQSYDIVGNLCETDTFAQNRTINEARENDLLCIRNAGAYGFEMASQFNSQYRPAEVMVKDGKDYLIRKRDTLQDLLQNQIRHFK